MELRVASRCREGERNVAITRKSFDPSIPLGGSKRSGGKVSATRVSCGHGPRGGEDTRAPVGLEPRLLIGRRPLGVRG